MIVNKTNQQQKSHFKDEGSVYPLIKGGGFGTL